MIAKGTSKARFGGVVLTGAALSLLLAACSTTQSVVPLATDTIQVTVQAHGECDLADAKVIAARRIAVETIRRGFDGYTIIGSASRSFNPAQEYTVRMSRRGQSATAMDARAALGPEWERTVADFSDRICRV